jgi:hypothetical protein
MYPIGHSIFASLEKRQTMKMLDYQLLFASLEKRQAILALYISNWILLHQKNDKQPNTLNIKYFLLH